MASTVKINHSEIQSYLDGGHGVSGLLDSEAQSVLSAAQGNAPVLTGAYRASLHIETDHTDRTVRRVVADVPYALIVEAEHGVLARSV